MIESIRITAEQRAIIEEISALDARFAANPTLFHSLSAIASAKALIVKGLDHSLDERFVHPLQIWISLHDTDQQLPERLRPWTPTP